MLVVFPKFCEHTDRHTQTHRQTHNMITIPFRLGFAARVMTQIQRNLNAIVIHNSNTDVGSNSNSNILIFKVMVIIIYYTDLGGISNSNRFLR